MLVAFANRKTIIWRQFHNASIAILVLLIFAAFAGCNLTQFFNGVAGVCRLQFSYLVLYPAFFGDCVPPPFGAAMRRF